LLQQRLSAGYSDAPTQGFTDLDIGFRANNNCTIENHSICMENKKMGANGTLSFLGVLLLKSFYPKPPNETDLKKSRKSCSNLGRCTGFESHDNLWLGLDMNIVFLKWSMQSSIFSNSKEAYELRPLTLLKTNAIWFSSQYQL
jgi:iron complex outermembrane receptor protein